MAADGALAALLATPAAELLESVRGARLEWFRTVGPWRISLLRGSDWALVWAALCGCQAAVAGWVRQRDGGGKKFSSPALRRRWLLLWRHPHHAADGSTATDRWALLSYAAPSAG
jgi:hypothetical protein